MSANGPFNPAMLLLARNLLGASQMDMADKLHITQAFYSKIETGVARPTDALLRDCSIITCHPESFFFIPAPIRAQLPPQMMYRKQAATRKDIDTFQALLSFHLLHLRELNSAFVNYKAFFDAMKTSVKANSARPEEYARAFRAYYGRQAGPIEDLTGMVEASGVICIPFSHVGSESDAIDGVSFHVMGLPPVIFYNKDRPADRQRFTIAHELGHLLMHDLPNEYMEQQANNFASELLMPSSDFNQIFYSGVDFHQLAFMKPVWKVSIAALVMRAKTLNKVSDYQNRILWQNINRLGWRKVEPPQFDFAPETPRALKQVLASFSKAELAEKLRIHVRRMEEIYDL